MNYLLQTNGGMQVVKIRFVYCHNSVKITSHDLR